MRRAVLLGIATVVLHTTLAGCATDLSRAVAYCQEEYFGFGRSNCEQQARQRYDVNSRTSER